MPRHYCIATRTLLHIDVEVGCVINEISERVKPFLRLSQAVADFLSPPELFMKFAYVVASLLPLLVLSINACSKKSSSDAPPAQLASVSFNTPTDDDQKEWAKATVSLVRSLPTALTIPKKTFSKSDFTDGEAKDSTMVVEFGTYTIDVAFIDSEDEVVYETCDPDVEHKIDTAKYAATIKICVPGSTRPITEVTVTGTSEVTIKTEIVKSPSTSTEQTSSTTTTSSTPRDLPRSTVTATATACSGGQFSITLKEGGAKNTLYPTSCNVQYSCSQNTFMVKWPNGYATAIFTSNAACLEAVSQLKSSSSSN